MLWYTERKDTANTCEANEKPRLPQNLFPNPIGVGALIGLDWVGCVWPVQSQLLSREYRTQGPWGSCCNCYAEGSGEEATTGVRIPQTMYI